MGPFGHIRMFLVDRFCETFLDVFFLLRIEFCDGSFSSPTIFLIIQDKGVSTKQKARYTHPWGRTSREVWCQGSSYLIQKGSWSLSSEGAAQSRWDSERVYEERRPQGPNTPRPLDLQGHRHPEDKNSTSERGRWGNKEFTAQPAFLEVWQAILLQCTPHRQGEVAGTQK